MEQKTEKIDGLIEENDAIGKIYEEVVPELVDRYTFWTRYFYKVSKMEDARAKLVKRAIAGGEEEEELSWDVDEDEEDSNGKVKARTSESPNVEELRKRLSAIRKDEDEGEELDWDIEDDDEPLKS